MHINLEVKGLPFMILLACLWFRGYGGMGWDGPPFAGVWFEDIWDGIVLGEEYPSRCWLTPSLRNERTGMSPVVPVSLRERQGRAAQEERRHEERRRRWSNGEGRPKREAQ